MIQDGLEHVASIPVPACKFIKQQVDELVFRQV